MSKLPAIACIFAIGLVVALGLFLFWKGARNVQRALASAGWPTTKGVVTGSESRENTNNDAKSGASSVMYSTETTVRYYVNAQKYTTDLIHFGQTFGSGNPSEAALQAVRYPVRAEVSVSYNPGDPATAVVKPGLHAEAFWLSGAGLAFLLPAIMCIIVLPNMFRGWADNDREPAEFQESVRKAQEDMKQGVTRTIDLPPGSEAEAIPVLQSWQASLEPSSAPAGP